MLRFMTSIISARKLCLKAPMLSRWRPMQPSISILSINHYPTDFQIATFTRTPINFKYKDPKERETCPVPPPPPPPPPKDDTMVWAIVAMLFGVGVFSVYAKTNPEIRDWLSINAAWFDEFLAVVYQENMSYGEFASACIDDTKRFLAKYNTDDKPKECSSDGAIVKDCPPEPPPVEEKPEECNPPPPPIVIKSICEVEKCLMELYECAINNYNTATAACACYNSLVQSTMETFTYKGIKELRHAVKERLELVETSLKNASHCISKTDDLIRYVECGGTRAPKEQVKNTKLMCEDYKVKLKAGFMAYQWENDKSTVMDTQWQMVEGLLDKYTSENEYMFNGLKYSSKKPHANGDLDPLFTNSLRYIQELQSQLNTVSSSMTERIDRAIEDLPQKSPTFAKDMANAIKNSRAAAAKDFRRREDEQNKRNDRELKEAIKKQNEAFEKNLACRSDQITQQVMVKFNEMVADKVALEKNAFANELELMAAKLKVVEDKLQARLKAERETRRSQELWAAGASLLQATKKGDKYVRVDKELKAIEKASGDHDKLVLTVLKSIPKSVREQGIVPESVLRDRFNTMEKTAKSVALVEQEGAPMPVYLLSWLQGLLLFMKVTGIPQGEFEKPPLEPPDHLDTFDLLQRARFWMDRGNLAVAVRYVESLKGASRAAALRWFEDARDHLEVRQAAEAVLAHATALGLRYI